MDITKTDKEYVILINKTKLKQIILAGLVIIGFLGLQIGYVCLIKVTEHISLKECIVIGMWITFILTLTSIGCAAFIDELSCHINTYYRIKIKRRKKKIKTPKEDDWEDRMQKVMKDEV